MSSLITIVCYKATTSLNIFLYQPETVEERWRWPELEHEGGSLTKRISTSFHFEKSTY